MGPLLCTTSPPLRSAMLSCRLQPSLFAPCSYSTSSPPPTSARIQDLKRPRPIHSQTLKSSSPQLTTTFVRSASQLTSTSSDTTSAVAQPNSPPPTPVTDHLDWNRFLQLRKVRRRYNLVASIGSSIGTTMLGVSVISQQDMETLGGQMFGLDPFVVLGLTTAGFGALGWLAGPFVGSAAFNMFNRKYKGQIAEKEREFYHRIKRYRVDPSSQSYSNPVPDYYGEKIGSVRDYRQWLKDQRAYNKKRQSFL
ncbi:TIM23 complex component [Acarospora aff. strigata]|nr:TIM23 complex component [Acarospora aff. strigata]